MQRGTAPNSDDACGAAIISELPKAALGGASRKAGFRGFAQPVFAIKTGSMPLSYNLTQYHAALQHRRNAMNTLDYTTAPAALPGMLAHVASTQEPVLVTRTGHDPVVMLSLEAYEALEETAYLLRSPANARRLLESIEQMNRGQSFARELIE